MNVSRVAHLVTRRQLIQECVKDIMFKPWLTLGQTGGVTMAPLFAQADRQMVTGSLFTITHRKEEINSKCKNAFSPRLRHSAALSLTQTAQASVSSADFCLCSSQVTGIYSVQ